MNCCACLFLHCLFAVLVCLFVALVALSALHCIWLTIRSIAMFILAFESTDLTFWWSLFFIGFFFIISLIFSVFHLLLLFTIKQTNHLEFPLQWSRQLNVKFLFSGNLTLQKVNHTFYILNYFVWSLPWFQIFGSRATRRGKVLGVDLFNCVIFFWLQCR